MSRPDTSDSDPLSATPSSNPATASQLDSYLQQLPDAEPIRRRFQRFGLRYRWLAIATTMLGMFTTLLAGTIINVAIPDLMTEFAIGQEQAQWLATGHLAAATIGMLLTAHLVAHFGLRLSLMLAMTVFLVGSLLGGVSQHFGLLIVSRLLLGLSAGIVSPMGAALIFLIFPRGQQGFAMGIAALGAILAPAFGPAVGGLVVEAWSWRQVFWLGVPFALLCLPLAWALLPEKIDDDTNPHANKPFDWLSLLILSVGLSALLLGLSGQQSLAPSWRGLALLLAAIGAALFIWRQRLAAKPLLNLALYQSRQYRLKAIIAFAFGAAVSAAGHRQRPRRHRPTADARRNRPRSDVPHFRPPRRSRRPPPCHRLWHRLFCQFVCLFGQPQ